MQGKLRNMASLYLCDETSQKILMLYRVGSKVVRQSYIGTAGGHFENDELNDARACIIRELHEETGLTEDDITGLKLRYVTLRSKKGEIRQNYYFFAKMKNSKKEIKSNEGILKWFDYEEIDSLDMPHTAKYVIKHYIEEGKDNNKLYGGIAVSNGINFTELKEF